MTGFRAFCVTLLFSSALSIGLYAQGRPSESADYTAAEEHHKYILEAMPDSMDALPIRADGTKGYTTSLPIPEPGLGPSDPAFSNSDDANLHRVLCSGSDAVVIAKLIDARARFSSGDKTIFTRYEFAIGTTLHQSPSQVIPSTIYVVNLGGTLVKDGLRIVSK